MNVTDTQTLHDGKYAALAEHCVAKTTAVHHSLETPTETKTQECLTETSEVRP